MSNFLSRKQVEERAAPKLNLILEFLNIYASTSDNVILFSSSFSALSLFMGLATSPKLQALQEAFEDRLASVAALAQVQSMIFFIFLISNDYGWASF